VYFHRDFPVTALSFHHPGQGNEFVVGFRTQR
jgi:hypothetical protein